jgi:hypothetical protein
VTQVFALTGGNGIVVHIHEQCNPVKSIILRGFFDLEGRGLKILDMVAPTS